MASEQKNSTADTNAFTHLSGEIVLTTDGTAEVRRRLIEWLTSSDDSPETTEAWIHGYKLPAIVDADPPFVSIVEGFRAAPSRQQLEETLAQRLKPLLERLPRTVENQRLENHFLYNLFNLCAAIAVRNELFPPLKAVCERASMALPNWGQGAKDALREALVANQIDNQLWPVWEGMLKGERHLILLGTPDDGFHATRLMPPSVKLQGQPAVTEIGIALKNIADRLVDDQDRRIKMREYVASAIATYPNYDAYHQELIYCSHELAWPTWAVECLPVLFCRVLETVNEWLVWRYCFLCFPDAKTYKFIDELCGNNVYRVRIDEKDVNILRPCIEAIERGRNSIPFPSHRAVVGAVLYELVKLSYDASLHPLIPPAIVNIANELRSGVCRVDSMRKHLTSDPPQTESSKVLLQEIRASIHGDDQDTSTYNNVNIRNLFSDSEPPALAITLPSLLNSPLL